MSCAVFVITHLHINGGRNAFCVITQGRDGHSVGWTRWKSSECLFLVRCGVVLSFVSRREQRHKTDERVVLVFRDNPANGDWCRVQCSYCKIGGNAGICEDKHKNTWWVPSHKYKRKEHISSCYLSHNCSQIIILLCITKITQQIIFKLKLRARKRKII